MKKVLYRLGLALVVGFTASFFTYHALFGYIELFYEDAIYQNKEAPDNKIKIIAIDDKTLGELGDHSNWSRQVYADLICKLNEQQTPPKVIAFDIMFFDYRDEAGDNAFVNACKNGGNVIVASKLSTATKYVEHDASIDTMYVTDCDMPFDELAQYVETGYVNVVLDNDGFVRHSLARVSSDDVTYRSLSTAISEKYLGRRADCQDSFLIDYTGGPSSYEIISLCDVLDGTIPVDIFSDGIIIVGGCTEGTLDSYGVPIDRHALMYGTEINANIVQAILDNKHISYLDRRLSALLTGLFAAIFMLITHERKKSIMTAALIIALCGHFALCFVALENGLLVVVLYPIIAYIIAFIINLVFRFASERRQRAQELHELLFSMAEAMTEAIDGRTPYNASHTRKVADYSLTLAKYINKMHKAHQTTLFLSKNETEQLHLAALLHDVGKLDIPLRILDKPTKLAARLDGLYDRYEKLGLRIRLDAALTDGTDAQANLAELSECREFIENVNAKEWLSDEERDKLVQIKEKTYTDSDGNVTEYITDDEFECLGIKKGTLTEKEMETVHMHAVYTDKILERIRFGKNYSQVRKIASSHHELLNGTGYPNKLSGEQISLSIRILTIADIFDALTADDRPYKKVKSREVSFNILHSMANEGLIDGEVLELAEQAWQK